MTDHRRRAEEVYATVRSLGGEGHPIGWGHNWCASENEGDFCCIEKGKNVLVDSVASALKEVEEETWARAIGCVEKALEPASKADLSYLGWGLTALTALREEAAKK